MKQERRHELKTNDLSVYLQQLTEGIKKYSTHIVGGVIAVALVLVISMFYQRNRADAAQAAWAQYQDIQQTDPIEKPEVIDQSRTLMDKYLDDPALGPAVLCLHGAKLYEAAISMGDLDSKEQRVKLLTEARNTFGKLIEKYAQRKFYQAMGQTMLALVEESLVVEGDGKVETVRKLYEKRLASDNPMYKALARANLDSLDERLKPLDIIETPEPPTSSPAEGDSGPDASDNTPDEIRLRATDALEEEPAASDASTTNQ